MGSLHKSMNVGWWIVGGGSLVRQMCDTDPVTEAVHAAGVERFRSPNTYEAPNLATYLGRPGHRVAGGTGTDQETDESLAKDAEDQGGEP